MADAAATLRITCPSCHKAGNAPARLVGKTVRCSQCGMSFLVQATAPAATPVAAPPAPAPPPAEPAVPTAVAVPAPIEMAPRPVVPAPTVMEAPATPAPVGPAPTVFAPSVPPSPPGRGPGPGPTVLEAAPAEASSPGSPVPTVVEPAPAVGGPREWKTGDVVLGLYEVAGLLGQGGMGRVYRVHHRGWGVDLAVKVPLKQALDAAGGVEAFEREAETWVNLPLHPHMVSCYYVRRLEGIPRVFAEFVDGGTLGDAIRNRKLVTLDAILDAAIQFAWGLHDAHEQGLVHRDVKPANVMITAEGVAKVTDFGLAGARIAP
ncbi:MAG TPA: protein kinase, partial [Vicinamibacteria bacterium]|nr:protein kinase [Vicinamibacteria bacterium]